MTISKSKIFGNSPTSKKTRYSIFMLHNLFLSIMETSLVLIHRKCLLLFKDTKKIAIIPAIAAILLSSSIKTQSLFAVVVTSLRYTAVSSTSLSLAWDDAVGNTAGYQMYLSTVPGFAITIASGTTPDGVATTSYINLQPNTTHTFVVKDAADSDSSYLAISTYTWAVSPGIAGFNIYQTSATIFLDAGLNNLNATSTPLSLAVSTGNGGNFAVSLSSIGSVTSQISTFTITGLSLDTNYSFQASATNYFGLRSTATTVTSSTYTTSAPPTLSSFQIFTTSISVVLALNGNATTTPFMISTGTGGDFGVTNSSVGTFGSGPITMVISNLSTATVYGFQAGTRGTYANASTQTITVTASTSTLAVAPLLSSFKIYATSVEVRIDPNTNPNGTKLSVSTSNFGVASSSIGAALGITTLTITGLTPTTDYNINIGAFDSTVNASTESQTGNEISTRTAPAVPNIASYEIFTTSISVTLGPNGNLAGTGLMISTGTNGNYNISNSSIGVFGSGGTTLVISNLSTATIYGFQAGTRDSTANASTQSVIINASTATFATAPLVNGFKVFATSITVNIDPNGNPNGTMLSVSTNSFNAASSSAGAAIGITTLTITNLTPNVAYDLNIGAFVALAGVSTQSASGNEISTRTLAAVPTITGFQIFSSSISVTLGANGNPNGTTIAISTGSNGNFSVSKSSIGVVAGANTILVIESLALDTNYAFQAGANDSTQSASTQSTTITASTYTTSAPPTLSSFQIFTTSISVVLTLNGNATTTPFMISTGTGGDFGVTNSSVGTFGSGPITMVISNLSTATVYGFQAGTRGTYANASTQTITVTASTSTLAVAPTLTGFQVFTTSISVILGANTNPIGTPLVISTGNAGNFSVTKSSVGVVAAANTTLFITGLTGGANYAVQAGARDLSNLASTQTITVTASTTTAAADSTAPDAITSLSALIGSSSGTITLSWISPGDDNLTGDLNSATFRIFYSSVSSDMNGLGATTSGTGTLNRLDISTTGVSPYTTRNRTLSDLIKDVTYYTRAFTADDQTNWSAISNAATATAQGTILSITFDNNSYAFGTFNAPQSTISATAMKVTNSGSVTQRYQIKATTSTANSPWSLGNARGNNIVAVNGLFNAARPANVDFESVSSTLTVSNTASGTSGGTFAGDQTGTAVPANADRNFWIRLGMPLSTTTTAQQQIQIIITAEESP